MPIPGFVPLIGSSFDALAAQQAGWAGFNANVEQANLARLAAQQSNQNQWLRDVAVMRNQSERDNIAAQLEQDRQDRLLAWQQAQERTRQAERGQDIVLNKQMWQERLAEERARTESAIKRQEMAFDLQQKQQEQSIEQHGQAAASTYLMAKHNADLAHQELDQVDTDIESKTQQMATTKDALAKTTLGQAITDLRKRRNGLQTAANRAEAHFQNVHQGIINKGYDINEDEQAIVHPASGKRWSFRGAVSQAKTGTSGGNVLSPMFLGPAATAEALSTPVSWAGFQQPRVTPVTQTVTNQPPTKRWVWDRDQNRPVLVQ